MHDIIALQDWKMVDKAPIVIAGPCSAETEEQLYNTCKQIVEHADVTLLRAGIWKPRTRPGSFEGIGEAGLKWFRNIKKELNKPITVEVANAQHVELALKYGVDVLWVGARSTVNPFTMQEIADALKGVKDVPVIVKNPINPDLALWVGALERIYNSGVRHLAALHRGFSSFEKTEFRNVPMWNLAIELKTELPTIPLICDPSHIAGKRELIYKVSQKAMDLDYDGLMIETHWNPEKAWSDAAQQVTPEALAALLKELHYKRKRTDDQVFNSHLEDLRKKVDRVDNELLEILATRMALVEEMGEYKRDNNITVFQADRWIDIFQSRPQLAQKLGLSKSFAEQLFKLVHDESIRIQTKVLHTEKE